MSSSYQSGGIGFARLREAVVYFRRALRNFNQLKSHNLHDTEEMLPNTAPVAAEDIQYRKADGSYNNIEYPQMGAAGTRFSRNVPLEYAWPEDESTILEPNPLLISEKLLARKEFKPAKSINLLAAAWVQFQAHDWFGHELGKESRRWEVEPAYDKDGSYLTGRSLSVERTRVDPPRLSDRGKPPAYVNTQVHWWDCSQIYGSDLKTTNKLRKRKEGKLKTIKQGGNELLPVGENGIDQTGVTDNWWLGLSLFHTLFTLEHNQICDQLQKKHPTWSDDKLFEHARLINAALMAKIHTLEWTPAMLDDDRIINGLRADWWGVSEKSNPVELIEVLSRTEGKPNLLPHRLYGTSTDHFGALYAMTEEFVAVYRMHPMLPDEVEFRSIDSPRAIASSIDFAEAVNEKARQHVENKSLADLFFSFGFSNPGAVTLHNYPQFLRNLKVTKARPGLVMSKGKDGAENIIDLGALDILRDRERGIPRYNQFRQLLGLAPFSDYIELTNGNQELADQLEQVYEPAGGIDRVDLMVGLFAEHLPEGFAFSSTAFQVFTLMAPRRLKGDRFYTTDYTPRVYTSAGMEWIEKNTLATVLRRNCPELAQVLINVNGEDGSEPNPFKPEVWRSILRSN
jgi:hypothetical protein